MQVLASGIAASGEIEFNRPGNANQNFMASLLMVRAATNATIGINGFVINLPTSAVNYTSIPVEVDRFIIYSGTVDYIALG